MERPIRNIRISENFVPVSEFKARAAQWLRQAGETGAPVVVTQNGKPAGVLLSPEVFDKLTEQARFVAAVEEGLADANAGRVQSHNAVARRMRSRFGGAGK
jgi:prevent-host-death family protein